MCHGILKRVDKSAACSSASAALLFVSNNAGAQGLVGGLAGLTEAYFMIWGVAGIVPALMLAIAHFRAKNKGANGVSYWLAVPALLYAPTAISLIFYPSDDFASKFPGAVGFALLFALVAFYVPKRGVLRRSLTGALAAVFAVLMVTPNAYWEVPFVSFERVEFIDNVAPRELIATLKSRSAPKHWLALEDGRHFLQKESETGWVNSTGELVFPYGYFAVVESTSSRGAGNWFEVTHYDWSSAYIRTLISPRPRYVIPLITRTDEKYRPAGLSLVVLLDESANVDYEQMLDEILAVKTGSWGSDIDDGDKANVTYWAKALSELADIELDSPEFLSKVFSRRADYYSFMFLVDSGVSPDSVDKSGDTMLHVAVRKDDSHSATWLLENGANPQKTNAQGQTPLELARERYKTRPNDQRLRTFERLLDVRAN